jgi:hypothetical protein
MKSFLIKNRKKIFTLLGIMIVFSVFLFIPETSYAWFGSAVAKVLGVIVGIIVSLIGQILIMLLNILIKVAQYNDFIHSSAVTYGWILVRDLCNMFFVLILLVIAFATILRAESYNLKALLPKLIIMAILINFSKLICGIFIDFAQVIMLTFINAVNDIAGANLTHMLGIAEIMNADQAHTEISLASVVGSLLLALILVIVATMVVLTILAVLVMRIIMIWIYVVLSPLAYLLASFPQGKSHSERWWKEFSQNLIIGPVLAFFLWLSFASLGGTSAHGDDVAHIAGLGETWKDGEIIVEEEAATAIGVSQAGSMENMIKFIISIGMLLGGLMIAQEMGGHAGKIAGKGMGQIQAMGAGALKRGKRLSGIQRVEDAYKARKQMKDSKRSDRAQMDAGRVVGLEGRVKKKISQPMRWAEKKASYIPRWIAGVSDKKIKGEESAIKDKEAKIEGIKDMDISGDIRLINEGQQNIEDLGIEIEILGEDWRAASSPEDRERIDGQIEERRAEIAEKGAELETLKSSVVDNYKEVTGEEKEIGDISEEDQEQFGDKKAAYTQKEGEKLQEDYAKLSKKKRTAENVGRITAATIGAVAGGIFTGGLGAIAGAGLGLAGRQRIKHAGRDDLDLASNYNASQISKEKEKLKGKNEDELRAIKDDYSLDTSIRTAVELTLMDRRELSQDEAKESKDKIVANYGYDGRVLDQLDSSLARNYQQLSRLFTDLNSSAPPIEGPDTRGEELRDKHKRAQEKIVKQIIHNEIHMDSINDQKSIDLIMPELADVMDKANFKRMYDQQTNEKQDQIKLSLKNADTSESRVKLAIIRKSLDPLETGEKLNYLNQAKAYQFQDIAGRAVSKASLVKALEEIGKLRDLKNIVDANGGDLDRNLDNFRIKFNQDISKKAQFKDNYTDNGVLRAFMEEIARTNTSA